MTLIEENQSTDRKTCPSDTLYTTNPTRTCLGLNACIYRGRMVTDCFSHGMMKKCGAYPHGTYTSKGTLTNIHYVSFTQAITLTSFSMVMSRLTSDVCSSSFLVCKSDNCSFRTPRSANQLDVKSCCRDSLD
jgi:hypothetical protein